MKWILVIKSKDGWHASKSYKTLQELVAKYGSWIKKHNREYKIYGTPSI